MSKKVIDLCLAVVLACIGITACAEKKPLNRTVSERHVVQIDFSSWPQESFKVSPDNKRVAGIARVENKWFVVVNENEGRRYDGIVSVRGGRLVFDLPDTLHYLVAKGSDIYLVEERIE